MNLDRALIKSQAKALIKGNVFKLFVLIFVVTILASGNNIYSSVRNTYSTVSNSFSDSQSQSSDNPLDNYGRYSDDIDDFEDFSNEFSKAFGGRNFFRNLFSFGGFNGVGMSTSTFGFATLFLAPLGITLFGVFYELIKGKKMDWNEEFSYVFSKTFDKNYWNKFLLNLLTGIFTALWTLLFIIPGIVYYYKIYFVSLIMIDKPELTWKEAIEISKKMTDGHKGELFALDLSFIGWYFLVGITFGLVGIYVTPYVYTTKALYYENFKMRALQLGTMSEYDFLTEKEKAQMAAQNNPQPGTYYQPQQQNYYQAPPQNNYYQAPAPQQNEYYQPPVPQQNDYYQAPPQENTYQPPTEE